MSVRHGLLALLQRGPMYGYQLRVAFEESTGGTWPLNIGQVYTTLSRLERDGLVRPLPEGDGGQRPYQITDAGRADLASWFATPISRADRPRDELAIKLALALTTPGVDVRAVIQTQRGARCRSTPGSRHAPTSRLTCPGGWCSTRCSSRPRPRSAGWTTARRAWSGTPPHRPRPTPPRPATSPRR